LIRKIGKYFNTFESGALMISLALMVIVIFSQVVMRYVFNHSLSWSEEFARYLFVWFSWMGVSAGLKDNEHLRVEFLSMGLTKRGLFKTDEVFKIIVSLVWLATTAIVTYYGAIVVAGQADLGVVTPAMRLPVWLGYLAIPACSGVVGIRLIINIIDSVKKIQGKSTSGSEVAN
jgi:TRAP-type C4-dicarboxylate transport system permease small subunit